MDLRLDEVASLLHVSEHTVQRWVENDNLPSYQLKGELRFSRSEIEGWILAQNSKKDDLLFNDTDQKDAAWQTYSLYRALHRGDVVLIESHTKEGAIDEVICGAIQDPTVDKSMMIELLIDRERLMTTALGSEVAIPHTRESLIKGPHDIVVIALPKKPIDWDALDQKPVKVLFFLMACDDKRHLNLLAKIAHLTSNKAMIDRIKQGINKASFLELIRQWEHSLSQKTATNV